MHLRPTSRIPTRKERPATPDKYYPLVKKNRPRKESDSLLRAFVGSRAQRAEVIYDKDTYSWHRILSGLRNAIARDPAQYPGVRTVVRGDGVYLSRESSARPTPSDVIEVLYEFDRSGSAYSTFETPEGTTRALYAALQYQRTRLGLGHLRIGRVGETTVSLRNPFVDESEDNTCGS